MSIVIAWSLLECFETRHAISPMRGLAFSFALANLIITMRRDGWTEVVILDSLDI